jgi:LacI family transcriptional regulator
MSITLHDIAREVGVSIATVSRVLSKSDYPVNSATHQKVLDVAAQLGYRPNLMARNLSTEQSYTNSVTPTTVVR